MNQIFQNIILLSLVTFWSIKDVQAITYNSIQDGYWNDATSWQGGVLPDLADTIIIHHSIIFTQDLNVPSSGYLYIDSDAMLCGIYNLETDCGSFFYNWGTVKADQVNITDGGNYGFIHALQQYHVSPCLNTTAVGAAEIGGTFNCDSPTSIFEADNPYEPKLNAFPNPFFDRLNYDLKGETINGSIIILQDYSGRDILKSFADKTGYLNVSGLRSGIYIRKIFHNERWYIKTVVKG